MDKDNYDMAATVFSPDGRVYQVEYAREAIKRGGLAMAMKYSDGIVFSIMKTIHSSLIEEEDLEKFYLITDHIGAAASGLIADARILADLMREIAQQDKLRYGEEADIRSLVLRISRINEIYTRYEGVRPFGAAMVIGGYDEGRFQLYETDPSGVFQERSATAIGNGSDAAIETMERKYSGDLSKEDLVKLSCRIIKDTRPLGESNGFTGIELYILTKEGVEKIDVDSEDDLMELIGEGIEDALISFLDSVPRITAEARVSIISRYDNLDQLSEASMEDLMELDGIGRTTAKRIKKSLEER